MIIPQEKCKMIPEPDTLSQYLTTHECDNAIKYQRLVPRLPNFVKFCVKSKAFCRYSKKFLYIRSINFA